MRVNDEWRLQVEFAAAVRADAVKKRLAAGQVEHDLNLEFHEKVIVSSDGSKIFVYASTHDQIDKANAAILADAQKYGWRVESELRRWHPLAEEWEDPAEPLPASEDTRHEERETLMARERAAVSVNGYPEFEVRADLPSHHDVVELSKRLRKEGLPAIYRWRYLVVGATDEDSAHDMAERIAGEAPSGTKVRVEGTWAAVLHERPNPFAIMS
jgi:hypothetical protein